MKRQQEAASGETRRICRLLDSMTIHLLSWTITNTDNFYTSPSTHSSNQTYTETLASTTPVNMYTRSRTASRTPETPNMTLEVQFQATARNARMEALEQQLRAQRALKAAEKKAREQKDLEQAQAEREAAGALDPENIAFDFDAQSMETDSSSELDPQLHQPLIDTTFNRLQRAGAEVDPSILFPRDRIFPKVAVLLRCLGSHVIGLPGAGADALALPDDSHAIAQIRAPCPQCGPAAGAGAAATEVFFKRKCPFCMQPMVQFADGRYVCLSGGCWLSRCAVESGTEGADVVWKEVARKMGNRYFFVGPWEDVLTFRTISTVTLRSSGLVALLPCKGQSRSA